MPAEQLPDDTDLLKFVRIGQSCCPHSTAMTSSCAHRYAAGAYETGSSARYPVLFHVAGLNGRYTRSQRLLSDDQFMEYWLGSDTPAAVIVFLDGESPYGDSIR